MIFEPLSTSSPEVVCTVTPAIVTPSPVFKPLPMPVQVITVNVDPSVVGAIVAVLACVNVYSRSVNSLVEVLNIFLSGHITT